MQEGSAQVKPNSLAAGCVLRILATSDLHMHLTGFNYLDETSSTLRGLSRIATLVEKARNAVTFGTTLLLDNGDALQGNAITDALNPEGHDHPMAAAFNALGYDAVGLGNHDFDFGLPYLDQVIGQYSAPVVSSNLVNAGLPAINASLMITRHVACADGATRRLRIGILSVLPEQTVQWNSARLPKTLDVTDMIAAAQNGAVALKEQGADIVVLLAHSGIGTLAPKRHAENNALRMAELPDIDAVIAGHTHQLYTTECEDAEDGTPSATRATTPTAMPGCCATHLAQIDLSLAPDGEGWHVEHARSRLYPVTQALEEHPEVLSLCQSAHRQARTKMNTLVAQLHQPINSFFNMIHTSPDVTLLAQAITAATQADLAKTAYADLPVLTAIAPMASGGKVGPSYYLDIPEGRLEFRHLRLLCPFDNLIWGVVVSGRDIKEWLERSAAVFHQLRPITAQQYLIDPSNPRYNFDIISELSYVLDLTEPPKYSGDGDVIHPDRARVRQLTWRGKALDPDQQFLVLTTNYRASGGGGFPGLGNRTPTWRSTILFETALTSYLAGPSATRIAQNPKHADTWRIATGQNRQAIFETSPNAIRISDQLAHYDPQNLGPNTAGFLEYRLSF